VAANVQTLSPELALIDPHLAVSARNQLPQPDDTLARLEPHPTTALDRTREAAVRRLNEYAAPPEELAERRRSYRASKLVGAITTWAIALVLVGDARLYDPSTWSH
jgi:hypothetical protein